MGEKDNVSRSINTASFKSTIDPVLSERCQSASATPDMQVHWACVLTSQTDLVPAERGVKVPSHLQRIFLQA